MDDNILDVSTLRVLDLVLDDPKASVYLKNCMYILELTPNDTVVEITDKSKKNVKIRHQWF